MEYKRAVSTFACNIEEILAGGCLVAVISLTLYNIVNRYALHQSAAWAPELAGFIFTWAVFLGVSAAAKRSMHVSMSAIVECFSPSWRARTRTLVDIVLVLFFAYSTYLAAKLTLSSHTRVSPVMRLPFSYVYAITIVCFALMFARTSLALLRRITRRSDERDGSA